MGTRITTSATISPPATFLTYRITAVLTRLPTAGVLPARFLDDPVCPFPSLTVLSQPLSMRKTTVERFSRRKPVHILKDFPPATAAPPHFPARPASTRRILSRSGKRPVLISNAAIYFTDLSTLVLILVSTNPFQSTGKI